jgi:mannose-1-phosphate guanylyltransferase
VKAIVLVGGEGTRMRPLTFTTPKQLLPLLGSSIFEDVVLHLSAHGVDEIMVSLGYLPQAFMEHYPDGHCQGVAIRYALEPQPLDTAGAIRFAAEDFIDGERFVVVNGDVLTDLDLTALIDFHHERGAQGTIALHPVEDPSRFGVVPTEDDGRVIAFVEKPAIDEAPTNLINAGTYVFEASVLERIPFGERVSIERTIFPEMVIDGQLFAKADAAYWLDTGTPQSYLQAHDDLLSGRREGAQGLVDGSYLGEATLTSGATISASSVGSGSQVAAGTRVKNSILLPGVVIAGGCSIEDSILGHGVSVGAGATIQSVSVIGDGVVIPAGATIEAEKLVR